MREKERYLTNDKQNEIGTIGGKSSRIYSRRQQKNGGDFRACSRFEEGRAVAVCFWFVFLSDNRFNGIFMCCVHITNMLCEMYYCNARTSILYYYFIAIAISIDNFVVW